jgi:hypothetical protein
MPTLLSDSQSASQLCRYGSSDSALHTFYSLLISSLVFPFHTSHPSNCDQIKRKSNQADSATMHSLRILESHLLFLFLHCIGRPCALHSTGPHNRCHCCWCSFAFLGSSDSGSGIGRGCGGWLCCRC